jgi:hypothetical protein
MSRKGFPLIPILLIAVGVLVIGGIWYYTVHKSSPVILSAPSVQSSSSPEIPNAATSPPIIVAITSSSSAQVGPFTVTAYCTNTPQVDIASVDHITVFNGSSTVQTIVISKGISPGSHSCPPITAQDINFDGHPDFMIDDDYGTGGLSVVYWLYSTSTGQFYCPGGDYNNCSLMNPSFDTASKTVTSQAPLGASDSFSQLYETTGGVLTLYQETDIDYSITTKLTTKTVKQLENGQMVVIGTSTVPEGTPATNSTSSAPADVIPPSISSAQVGNFLVTVNCTVPQNSFSIELNSINVSEEGSTTQVIPLDIGADESECPEPEAADINFDGYPDFTLDFGHGATGNEDLLFWIYNTSTQQFDCPNTNPGSNKPWLNCMLGGLSINFNKASGTITQSWDEGCASLCTDTVTDQWINGKMVTIQDINIDNPTDGSSGTIALTKTVSQLINGNMVVVSTSTITYPGGSL